VYIGGLDLAMSVLETHSDTIGTSSYMDIKIVSTDWAVFSKRLVFCGQEKPHSAFAEI
jgi:hypothetical protein